MSNTMTKIKILRKNYDGSIDKVFEVNLKFVAVLYIKEAIENETTNADGNYKVKIQDFVGDVYSFTGSEEACKNIVCNIIKKSNM